LSQKHLFIVAGVIRQGDDLLMVQEQGPPDPRPFWALPGGRAEAGELPHETLIREVREETGLEVVKLGRLLYVTEHHLGGTLGGSSAGDLVDPGAVSIRSTAMIFEVEQWHGTLHPNDPDAFIIEARFLPLIDATAALEAAPFRVMAEPLLAHLRGEIGPGAVWCYRRQPDGTDQLLTLLE
jgi:ADP-ribose pyrophosphatase YjhB (NUDIX family)